MQEVGTVHLGRNIKRIREMLHTKQETLGSALTKATGEDWSQQRVSLLESREDIDAMLLETIAKALQVTPEAIKNFSEEAAIHIFCNTFNDNATNNANYKCTINDVENILKMADENRKLYELLLKEKDEKLRLYEQFYNSKK